MRKPLLWISAIVLAVFSVFHVFITYEHWRAPAPQQESVWAPAALAFLTALAAVWLARTARRNESSA